MPEDPTGLPAATLRRYRIALLLFIAGLVASGLTAFPLLIELRAVARALYIGDPAAISATAGFRSWIALVLQGLESVHARYPFIAYGTDWLAFGHLAIALFFIRPLFRPLECDWVLRTGLCLCAGVIPLALIAGAVRGIPIWWRLIDCSFGVLGAIPLWYCRHLTRTAAVATTARPGPRP